MLVSAATNCGKGSARTQSLLIEYRRVSEIAIADRVQRGINEGDMPAMTDVGLMAKYVSVLIQGLAAQARDGTASDALHQVAELALNPMRITL